jgi:hypothetical protein
MPEPAVPSLPAGWTSTVVPSPYAPPVRSFAPPEPTSAAPPAEADAPPEDPTPNTSAHDPAPPAGAATTADEHAPDDPPLQRRPTPLVVPAPSPSAAPSVPEQADGSGAQRLLAASPAAEGAAGEAPSAAPEEAEPYVGRRRARPVHLGFGDGSEIQLDAATPAARALRELAAVLVRRD